MKIIDYTILTDPRMPMLVENVTRYIKDGWQPLGGPFADLRLVKGYLSKDDETTLDCECDFQQAMVKYEEPKPPGYHLAEWQARLLEEHLKGKEAP